MSQHTRKESCKEGIRRAMAMYEDKVESAAQAQYAAKTVQRKDDVDRGTRELWQSPAFNEVQGLWEEKCERPDSVLRKEPLEGFNVLDDSAEDSPRHVCDEDDRTGERAKLLVCIGRSSTYPRSFRPCVSHNRNVSPNATLKATASASWQGRGCLHQPWTTP